MPSLLDFVDDDPDELILYLFWAVWMYLKRSRQFRPGCRHLFISTGRTKKEVSMNTISFWLLEVIKRAHQSPERKITPKILSSCNDRNSTHFAFQKELCCGSSGGGLEEPDHLYHFLFQGHYS